MHNLTVAQLHSYYVLAGDGSVLVHNAEKCETLGSYSEKPIDDPLKSKNLTWADVSDLYSERAISMRRFSGRTAEPTEVSRGPLMSEEISREDAAALAELGKKVGSFLTLIGFDPALLLDVQSFQHGLPAGVRVEVDVNTPGSGVYVAWSNSQDLTEAVSRAVQRRNFSDPVLHVHGEALRIMFEALIALLRTGGFVVSEAKGYREYEVRVDGSSTAP
jgi:hypothetical protein